MSIKLKLFGDGDRNTYGDARTDGKCLAMTLNKTQCKRYARVMFPAAQVGIAMPGLDEVGVCHLHAALGRGDAPDEIGSTE